MKLSHLRGRKVCERVLRKGHVWRGQTMVIYWVTEGMRKKGEEEKAGVFVGTFASSKLDKSAVRRNRMRRRCREALRTVVQEHAELPSCQLLVNPRSSSLRTLFPEMQKDVRLFLSVLTTCQKQRSHRA